MDWAFGYRSCWELFLRPALSCPARPTLPEREREFAGVHSAADLRRLRECLAFEMFSLDVSLLEFGLPSDFRKQIKAPPKRKGETMRLALFPCPSLPAGGKRSGADSLASFSSPACIDEVPDQSRSFTEGSRRFPRCRDNHLRLYLCSVEGIHDESRLRGKIGKTLERNVSLVIASDSSDWLPVRVREKHIRVRKSLDLWQSAGWQSPRLGFGCFQAATTAWLIRRGIHEISDSHCNLRVHSPGIKFHLEEVPVDWVSSLMGTLAWIGKLLVIQRVNVHVALVDVLHL